MFKPSATFLIVVFFALPMVGVTTNFVHKSLAKMDIAETVQATTCQQEFAKDGDEAIERRPDCRRFVAMNFNP
jgi:hypothetical protein